MKLLNYLQKICFAISTLIVINVHASTTTWQWDLNKATLDGSSLSSDGTNKINSNILNADLTAFADTGGNNNLVLEQSTNLPQYGQGWGVKNKNDNWTSPDHAFDNAACPSGQFQHDGHCYTKNHNDTWNWKGYASVDYDMALISFDTSVELTEVGFSWVYRDNTDFTVLAYTGNAKPTLAGNTWAGITNEWTLVGSYSAANAGYYSINPDGMSSKYWLVGAFNDILDTSYDDNATETDAFKLKGLKGKTSISHEDVPEPAAFSFIFLGLFSLYARRNKNRT